MTFETLLFDALTSPLLAIGAFGTFALFLLLGLGALPFTAALDRSIGKEKALLLYAGILLVLTMLVWKAEEPPKRPARAGGVRNLKIEATDVVGNPFDRTAVRTSSNPFVLVPDDPTSEASVAAARRARNMYERYSDTSPLPPPTLDAPPGLPLEISHPPTIPGPAPGYRWVLRGQKPTMDPASTATIADIPEASFGDYEVQPGDVFDWIANGPSKTFIYIVALNGGEGWVKNGEEGYDALARRLTTEEGTQILVRFNIVGSAKDVAKKLDSNNDGEVTQGEIELALNAARQRSSGTPRTPTEGESWQLRRTVENLYVEALLRSGVRLDFRSGQKDTAALRRAAREMAKVGATGKENGEGWRKAASLLEVALAEVKRVGNPQTRTDVLLELLDAYRALHDEQSVLRVLAEYVRTNPDRPDGWTWLGDAARTRMGQASLAISYYDQALAKNPSYDEARLGKGQALALAGEHGRAAEDFRKASGAPGGKYFHALGLLRTGKLERAKSEVEALLRRDSASPEAMMLRGAVLYALGDDLASARSAFQEVARMENAASLRAQACYNLGLTCTRMGEKAAAVLAFDKAYAALRLGASVGPTPDEMVSPALGLAYLAWCEETEESHSQVLEHLEQARREAPLSSYLAMFAGMHATQEGNFASAKRALVDTAMLLAPDYAELDGWIGIVYLGLAQAAVESGADAKEYSEDFERAVAFMERAADREESFQPDAFAMRVREALVRAAAQHLPRRLRYSSALATAQRVLKRDKHREQPAALAVAGFCNFQLGEYKQCIRDLQQVITVVPSEADETHPWYDYRVYAVDRLYDVKRWRSLEKKVVSFEGVTLPRDWTANQPHKVNVRIDEGKLHIKGDAGTDGSRMKPIVEVFTKDLFGKDSFEQVELVVEIPGEVDGDFKNNNTMGIQVLQLRGSGKRARKSNGIGIFSDKGRVAVRVGNGKDEKFKDAEVHRLLDDDGNEIPWPSNGPVTVKIVRENADEGVMGLYLNDKRVFGDRISGLKSLKGPLALWVGGWSNQEEPFDVRVSDIEVIRKNDDSR